MEVKYVAMGGDETNGSLLLSGISSRERVHVYQFDGDAWCEQFFVLVMDPNLDVFSVSAGGDVASSCSCGYVGCGR